MPIYEYRCPSCGSQFELLLPMGWDAPPPCPGCRTPTERTISAAAFSLKGAGWAKDSYGLRKSAKKETKK